MDENGIDEPVAVKGGKKRPRRTLQQWLRRQALLRGLKYTVATVVVLWLVGRMGLRHARLQQIDRTRVCLVRVVDGRTLVVRVEGGGSHQWPVELAGVEVPREWQGTAVEALRRRIGDETVHVVIDADGPGDWSGPVRAWVYLPQGITVNEWMVEQGWAKAERRGERPVNEWLERLERRARAEGRGRWASLPAEAGPQEKPR